MGRVDFANLPVFQNPPVSTNARTELQLLQRYLGKVHRYRHGGMPMGQRGVTTHYASASSAPIVVRTSASRMFGRPNTELIWGEMPAQTNNATFAPGCLESTGDVGQIGLWDGVHAVAEFTYPERAPKVGFALVTASWMGDWNLGQNNWMRSFLATPDYGLWIGWLRENRWDLTDMGLGQPVASAHWRAHLAGDIRRSQCQLGDPALRLHVTPPVRFPTAQSVSGGVPLHWQAGADGALSRCFVYRSINGLDGFGGPLGFSDGLSFQDSAPPPGPKLYMVRAARLQGSGSGSYTNLSQGVFISVP